MSEETTTPTPPEPAVFIWVDGAEYPFVHYDDMDGIQVNWVEDTCQAPIEEALESGRHLSILAFAAVAVSSAKPKVSLDDALNDLLKLKRGSIGYIDRTNVEDAEAGPTEPAPEPEEPQKPATKRARTSAKSGAAGTPE